MLVRFAIEKNLLTTSLLHGRIINKRLVIIIDGPCYGSYNQQPWALRLVMDIIEFPGLLASVWALFIYHVIK